MNSKLANTQFSVDAGKILLTVIINIIFQNRTQLLRTVVCFCSVSLLIGCTFIVIIMLLLYTILTCIVCIACCPLVSDLSLFGNN